MLHEEIAPTPSGTRLLQFVASVREAVDKQDARCTPAKYTLDFKFGNGGAPSIPAL